MTTPADTTSAETTPTATTTQVYRVWIKTTPERIWAAITDPEWTVRYGYAAPVSYDLRPGGAFTSSATKEMKAFGEENGFPVPDTIIDGEVIEAKPPHR